MCFRFSRNFEGEIKNLKKKTTILLFPILRINKYVYKSDSLIFFFGAMKALGQIIEGDPLVLKEQRVLDAVKQRFRDKVIVFFFF